MRENPKFHDHVVVPKKAGSAWTFFNKTVQKEIHAANPEMKMVDIAKQVALKWNSLDDTQKQPYLKMQENDVIRHKRELKDLVENGYFINSDGVKSTDLKKKKKRESKVAKAEDAEEAEQAPKSITTASTHSQSVNKKRKATPEKKADSEPTPKKRVKKSPTKSN